MVLQEVAKNKKTIKLEVNMKRKTLIVLLVLLLVGILAFTVFACNDNKKPNNPGTDTPGGDGPGPDDDDPPEDETYAIVEALPKLVTGLDKVAATVGDINEGKAAYLGADIGLNFGLTADGLDVAADLDLSLKVSVDEKKSANNWALIGLKSDNKEVAQLFIHAEEKNKEVIYIKEALTGNDNWKRLSVLDTSASEGLTGLFTTPGGVEPDANYNDEGVAGFDTETGYHHVYNGGLIGRLFGLIDVMTNGTKVGEEYMFAKPVYKTEGTGDDEHEVFVGYAPEGGAPVIDFTADSPIGGLKIMGDSTISGIVNLVGMLDKLVDGALHAEAYDNGNRYVATLNRAGIGDLIGGLTGSFDLGDLVKTLEKLNPVLRLVLGMEVKDGKFNVLKYDDPADAPVLDIEFSVDPETAALTDLSIDFANGDIEGMGITLGLALSNIELSDKSSKAPDTETAGAQDLGINLALQAKLPAWATGAAIAVSINPNAVIGFDSEGYVQVDLSGIAGHATFNNTTIAEYTTYNSETGFAINLKPVYEFIAKGQTGDLRDQVYFIKCDLESIINNAIKPSTPASAETIQNAAFADETENETENETGTLGTLIDAIKALSKPGADILGGIGNIIGPALTDSNSIVKLLLAEITKGDSLTFKPALGAEIDDEIIITLDAPALVEFAMGKNLLGGAESQINITLYDASNPDSGKQPITLSEIFEGDLVDVMIDLVYTTMFENYQKTNPEATFAGYMASQTKPTDIVNSIIKPVAEKWNITVLKDGALTVSDIGDITATINMGSNGVNGLGITLGAFFVEDEASGDSVPSVWVSLIGNFNKYTAGTSISLDKVDSVIDSWDDFNATGGLQNALMELAVYALGVDIAA